MTIWKPIVLLLFLGACSPGQLYTTFEEAGAAGKAYVNEQIMVRQDYRGKKRVAVDAEYRAEMRSADEAERAGKMEKAKEHWAAARAVIDQNMPDLKAAKEKLKDFFEPAKTDPSIKPE